MHPRDTSIDLLRGLAIFTMIAANMAAHSLVEPHSLFMRLYGSLAAPLFIFLSGMMVIYTMNARAHGPGYYLKRGGMVILVAALMDIFLWGTVPATTFDVLYVIGLGMPVIWLVQHLHRTVQLVLILLIFLLTPVLQYTLGYAAYPEEPGIFALQSFDELAAVPVWKQFLVDGWFPVFPWLGVSLLGAWIGRWRLDHTTPSAERVLLFAGTLMLVAGALLWSYFNPQLYSNEGYVESAYSPNLYHFLLTRDGYSELFYPPTLYYLLLFLGFILILLVVMRRFQSLKILWPLSVYGRSSLLVYILHTVFIVCIFNAMETFQPFAFIGLYLLHATVLWVICNFVQILTKGKKLPFLLRFLLGG